ncbi:phage tail protein [Escherichia coli O68:H12]|uniref:phage tail protein n=1 Tax=Escherichia coli TaxID=562 RepID=UPI00168D98D7|nr:phage tail protein [Escherichia coli]QOD23646.1 phage tail protein [Escherichia coli O68:H12]
MANLPETPQWEDGIYQIEVSDPVLGGPDGISNRQAKQLASRTSYLKQKVEKSGTDLAAHIAAVDPHTQYATKASPTFTGTPTAPTPANGDNSKKLATTEFVAKALAALAGSAPETLDTLKELADALGNDPNFATTVLNKLAEKLAKDQNGADIPEPALFVKNLGLGEGAPAIGVPFFWPSAAMPNTVIDSWSCMVFLKFNGAKFSASDYPVLAKVFPSLVLPEARGDFIRIWDDGRGADGGRELLSWQAATNFSQAAGNIGGGAGHTINFHDGIAGNQPGFSRFNLTSNSVGDGVNFVAVRPRNIAFNFLVRAK